MFGEIVYLLILLLYFLGGALLLIFNPLGIAIILFMIGMTIREKEDEEDKDQES